MKAVKVLKTPNEKGEEPGENWPLMVVGQLGFNRGFERVFIVTDNIRASEMPAYPELDVDDMAQICVDAINKKISERLVLDSDR